MPGAGLGLIMWGSGSGERKSLAHWGPGSPLLFSGTAPALGLHNHRLKKTYIMEKDLKSELFQFPKKRLPFITSETGGHPGSPEQA